MQYLEYQSVCKIRLFLTTVILFFLPIGLGYSGIIDHLKENINFISKITLLLSVLGLIIYNGSVTWKQLVQRFVPYGYINWIYVLFSCSLGGIQNSLSFMEIVSFLAVIMFVIILLYNNWYVHNTICALIGVSILDLAISFAISVMCMLFVDDGHTSSMGRASMLSLCHVVMGLMYVLYPFNGAHQLCFGDDVSEWRRIMFGITSLWLVNILSLNMYELYFFF